MKWAALTLLAALGASHAVGAAGGVPAAGVYKQPHVIEVYDGPNRPAERWRAEHVLEIVPVDPTHAYVRTHMEFDNGHICGIYGIAAREGDALVYRPRRDGAGRCVLSLRRKADRIVFDDPDGNCRLEFCGMHGTFDGEGFALSGRRPIRYLKRLLASRQYAQAMAEWRLGQ